MDKSTLRSAALKVGAVSRLKNSRSESLVPVDQDFIDFVKEGGRENLSGVAAMRMQACIRRLLVRARKARLIQAREVVNRQHKRRAEQKSEAFSLDADWLRELHTSTDDAIGTSVDKVPKAKQPSSMHQMALTIQKLMHGLSCVARIADAGNAAMACDETALMMCELFGGMQCDVYRTEAAAKGQLFVRVNHRVYVPVELHGLFSQCVGSRAPVSFSNVGLAGEDLYGVLEWYEPRCGYREMLVKAHEQDRVSSMLRERKYRANRVSYRLREYGHAMVVPVFGGAAEGGEGTEVVALIQLLRSPGDAPFTADDEYMAGVLASHLAHSLRRAQVLETAQTQIGQFQKLHAWSVSRLRAPEDVMKLAASLFSSDDVAMYTAASVDGFQSERLTLNERVGNRRGGGPKLVPVVRGATCPIESVDGLEVLCQSGSSLALSDAKLRASSAGGAPKGIDSLVNYLRRPVHSAHRSMLVCPALLHRTVLNLGPQTDTAGDSPVVPVLLQWANAHGKPFGRKDLMIANAFTDVLGRLASEATMQGSVALLEERFRVGDQRRNALMDSSRMLANRMEMDELFSSVMVHAKDLMEVDRSTLFMVNADGKKMYTVVADGSAPIQIPIDKGLAGAAYTTGKIVNVSNAYFDPRFNREIDLKSGYTTKTVLCYPIHNSRDQVIAVIQLINKRSGLKFNKADEELIAAFCAQLAVSIENVLAIEEMNRSHALAEQRKQRMLRFLEIACQFVQGLPAHEVCELAIDAARECTGSTGAAIFVRRDAANSEVLPNQDVGAEAFFRDIDTHGRTASKRRASSTSTGTSGAAAEAAPPAKTRRKQQQQQQQPVDPSEVMLQVVPPASEASWQRVTLLAFETITSGLVRTRVIDVNDRGLPEELQQYADPPEMVSALAVPMGDHVAVHGCAQPQGVLVVWGAKGGYAAVESQVCATLATLSNHLLTTIRKGRSTQKAMIDAKEGVRALTLQREAMSRIARKGGAAELLGLYRLAHGLCSAVNCASCTLWLVDSSPAAEQRLRTYRAQAVEEADPAQPPAPKDAAATLGAVEVSAGGEGIVGQVLTTGRALNVPNAHVHHAYAPDVDEAVHTLDEGFAAVCAVPVRDHIGHVIGVLQASGKLAPQSDEPEQPAGLELWQPEIPETPAFSEGDVEFLTFTADRISSQLQYLDMSGKSTTEILDGQAASTQLQAKLQAQMKDLLDRRRELLQLSLEATERAHTLAQSASVEKRLTNAHVHKRLTNAHVHKRLSNAHVDKRLSNARPPASLDARLAAPPTSLDARLAAVATPVPPPALTLPLSHQLPRTEPRPTAHTAGTATEATAATELRPPSQSAARPTRRQHAASQPTLMRGSGMLPPRDKRAPMRLDALPQVAHDPAGEAGALHEPALQFDTPDALWEDLYQTLREL